MTFLVKVKLQTAIRSTVSVAGSTPLADVCAMTAPHVLPAFGYGTAHEDVLGDA